MLVIHLIVQMILKVIPQIIVVPKVFMIVTIQGQEGRNDLVANVMRRLRTNQSIKTLSTETQNPRRMMIVMIQ